MSTDINIHCAATGASPQFRLENNLGDTKTLHITVRGSRCESDETSVVFFLRGAEDVREFLEGLQKEIAEFMDDPSLAG